MESSNQTVSPLRQRMIEDMRMRKLAPKTQSAYIRAVRKFASFWAVARHRQRRGPAPLSVAPGGPRHLTHHAQRHDCGFEVSLRSHAGSPRGHGQDAIGAGAAQAAGGLEQG